MKATETSETSETTDPSGRDAPPPVAGGTGPVSGASTMIVLALVGAAVAVAIGVYGRVHQPTGEAIITLWFPSVLAMKAWLATLAFALAIGQLLSALWMYGRLPLGPPPRGLGVIHRWSGTAAFVISLPVAYHCLWSLGFQTTGTRQLVHSLFGCAFYGAIATKLLALRADNLPRWGLPVAGGALVTCLTGLWLTSSLWFFMTVA